MNKTVTRNLLTADCISEIVKLVDRRMERREEAAKESEQKTPKHRSTEIVSLIKK